MLTESQLVERLSIIGGSDAAAVLGEHKYTTAERVLQDKLGIPREPNPRLEECGLWGDFHEPNIREVVSRQIGWVIEKREEMYVHPVHTFMGCHLDGLILKPGALGVLEAKSMRFPTKEFNENRPQDHAYWIQLQHCLAVTGHAWGILAVLFGGNELKKWEFQRDDEFIEAMIQKEAAFWQTVLDARKEKAA